uniref:Tudor domain containing 1 n=1 Tax=Hypotaenidia okinawae TaxID=2861861 RepID=A0A6G1RF00_9GRUI
MKCWLSGIKPGGSKCTAEAAARFPMHTAGVKLQARVSSLCRDGAGVELTDNSTGQPKGIKEILISEKLAVKEVPQDEKNFPNKSADRVGNERNVNFQIEQELSVFQPSNSDLAVSL